MEPQRNATGLAALTICEALLLALIERDVLDKSEVKGLLEDAVATHRHAESATEDPEAHRAVAELLEAIIKQNNSGRGPF